MTYKKKVIDSFYEDILLYPRCYIKTPKKQVRGKR